jgi:hypothetical protein
LVFYHEEIYFKFLCYQTIRFSNIINHLFCYSIDYVVAAILSEIHRIPESTSLLPYRFVDFTLFCCQPFATTNQKAAGPHTGSCRSGDHAAIVISDILIYRARLACVNHSHHINEIHKVLKKSKSKTIPVTGHAGP